MTLANYITLVRLALIPVFLVLAAAFSQSYAAGQAVDGLRWAAVLVYLAAAISDALDGFVARKFNQRSRLGSILDPLADKVLLIAAILALTFLPWPQTFPIWFPVLVIARDLLIIGGAALLNRRSPLGAIRPSGWGKAATATQMAAVAWVLIGIPSPSGVIYLAALLTAISGLLYVAAGWKALIAIPGVLAK